MIGSGTLTKEIAGYLARTGFDALDDDALRATKEHILYTLGTILAGIERAGNQAGASRARAFERRKSGKHSTRYRDSRRGGIRRTG